MQEEIGAAAGVLWRYLDEHGATTLGTLKRDTKLSESMLHMAVGWLAREAKLEMTRGKRGVEVASRGN
jgi:Winged helix-turn-helix domain (DUF2582)